MLEEKTREKDKAVRREEINMTEIELMRESKGKRVKRKRVGEKEGVKVRGYLCGGPQMPPLLCI